jgi:serine/threonine protein kinase/uncharacterized protein YraI
MEQLQIGPFLIQEKIGSGSMAKVYKALDCETQMTVALKVLHPQWVQDETMVHRLKHEAEISSRLKHPNIIKIYGFGETEHEIYLAMEYMAAGSLERVFRQPNSLTLGASAKILAQVAAGLDYAHKEQVIHRDMKLANILIGSDYRVVLSDFGLARAVEVTRMTTTGTVHGTPLYISPEQARGHGEIDHRSDLYSLAVMMYFLATGYFPFTAEVPLVLLNKHLMMLPPPPTEVNPALPKGVNDVLLKGLAKNPGDRYPTAKALVDDFEQAIHGARPLRVRVMAQAPNPSTHSMLAHTAVLPPAELPKASHSPILVISSAMALVALLVAGMAVWQTRNQPSASPATQAIQVVRLPTVTAIPTHSLFTPTSVGTQVPPLVMTGRITGPRGANLRTGPGTTYQVIGALNYNTPVRLLYRTEDASWVEIESWNQMMGWVSTSLVEADGDIMQLAIMPLDEMTPIATPTIGATPTGGTAIPSTSNRQATPTSAAPAQLPPARNNNGGGNNGNNGGGGTGGGNGGTHGGGTGGTNGGGGTHGGGTGGGYGHGTSP